MFMLCYTTKHSHMCMLCYTTKHSHPAKFKDKTDQSDAENVHKFIENVTPIHKHLNWLFGRIKINTDII